MALTLYYSLKYPLTRLNEIEFPFHPPGLRAAQSLLSDAGPQELRDQGFVFVASATHDRQSQYEWVHQIESRRHLEVSGKNEH